MTHVTALRNLRSSIRGEAAGSDSRRTSAISAIADMISDVRDGEYASDEIAGVFMALENFANDEAIPFDLELTKRIANIPESNWDDSSCSWDSSRC